MKKSQAPSTRTTMNSSSIGQSSSSSSSSMQRTGSEQGVEIRKRLSKYVRKDAKVSSPSKDNSNALTATRKSPRRLAECSQETAMSMSVSSNVDMTDDLLLEFSEEEGK